MKHHHHRQTYKPETEPATWQIWTGAALVLAVLYLVIIIGAYFTGSQP